MDEPLQGSEDTERTEQPSHDPVEQLHQSWPDLSASDRLAAFHGIDRFEAEEFFLALSASDQAELISQMSSREKRSWMRLLAPDDAADVIQHLHEADRSEALATLDPQTRTEVLVLLAYAEDAAGGLMNARFARLRPEMSVDEAIRYLRVLTQTKVETIYTSYVLDSAQKLLGVVSLRELFAARPQQKVSEIMNTDLVTIPENMDQEAVAEIFSKYDLKNLPVVDSEGVMKGIVTVDDIVDVIREEATEDLQRLGGAGVSQEPYFRISIREMLKMRGGWLIVLFVLQMLTATVIGVYEKQIEQAIVLALFIPLIISTGGNSATQAATLIIRAIALGEISLRSWWRVLSKEIASGMVLGLILGILGVARVWLVPTGDEQEYHGHVTRVAAAIGLSVTGVVFWGSIVGSMLPLVLKKCRLDPATASTPFVATIMDVSGLIIYFTIASLVLTGYLL